MKAVKFTPERLRLWLAFFLIYFIWGSTYLAIRYAILTIPPFLMAGVRFTSAGLLKYGFCRMLLRPVFQRMLLLLRAPRKCQVAHL